MGHDHSKEFKGTNWTYQNDHGEVVATMHFDHHAKCHMKKGHSEQEGKLHFHSHDVFTLDFHGHNNMKFKFDHHHHDKMADMNNHGHHLVKAHH